MIAWQEIVVVLLAGAIAILVVLLLNFRKKETALRKENKKYETDIQAIKQIVRNKQNANFSDNFALDLEIKLKDRFISTLGHEIRTPINGMLGLLSIIKQSDDYSLEENQSIYLEIESLTRQLFSSISDLLDYIKLNNNVLFLEKINFNIYNELGEALRVIENDAENKKISIKHDYFDPNKQVYVIGDSARLKQIITNVIQNAYSFHKKDDVHIEYSLKEFDSNHFEFSLNLHYFGEKVKDIDELDCLSLGSNIIDHVYNSIGLSIGLNISKRLIELMGGSLLIEKNKNGVTDIRFNVILEKGLEPDFNNKKQKLILLVEDNAINQKVSLFALNKLGYDVDIAPNGKIAIEMFQSKNYDLILMDIQMPVMDGITATRHIREIESRNNVTHPIGIIAITANTIKEDRERCFAVGMNEYVSKPFCLEKFPEILSKFERK
ncbi:MAG: response regulator [Lentimicrobiaceae bacterium]|nr:response regulator [Lentimicrobiaceae bacterium]